MYKLGRTINETRQQLWHAFYTYRYGAEGEVTEDVMVGGCGVTAAHVAGSISKSEAFAKDFIDNHPHLLHGDLDTLYFARPALYPDITVTLLSEPLWEQVILRGGESDSDDDDDETSTAQQPTVVRRLDMSAAEMHMEGGAYATRLLSSITGVVLLTHSSPNKPCDTSHAKQTHQKDKT